MIDEAAQDPKDLLFATVKGEPSDFDESEITLRRFVTGQNPMSFETVCGVDSRVKVTATTMMPHMAICKLYMKSPSGLNYIGTGWLTHGNKLYTAGHCVYDRDAGDWMTSIEVVPGQSGPYEPYGRFRAVEVAATRGWVDTGAPRWDMGAIKLGAPVAHGSFLEPVLTDPATGGVCGYPADRELGMFQFQMIDTLTKQGGQFRYLLDTYGGQSGSPVLRDRTRAVGIHNYGGCPNSASDLYPEFIRDVDRW